MRLIKILLLSASLAACTSQPATEEKPIAPAKTPEKNDALREDLQNIVAGKEAEIGIAVIGPDGDTLSVHGDTHFPLMSVAKFPQALTLMHLVDKGKMPADEKLRISKHDLEQRTFSSLIKDHGNKEFSLSIEEAFQYSLGQSDNITSNVIFDRVGGPEQVDAYMHAIGIQDIGIGTDYWHLGEDINKNWSTPKAMALLLEKFYNKQVLQQSSRDMVWKAMVASTSGADRIKGLLPQETIVGHKTGTGSTNEQTGITEAFNDAGIVELGNSRHLTIVVFIKNSTGNDEDNARTIAKIADAVFHFYKK